jgi:hypothetical protein
LSGKLESRLQGQGLALPLGTLEQFGARVAAKTKRWGEVIRKGVIPKSGHRFSEKITPKRKAGD